MTNYSIRNRAHVVNNKISRWPQDEIDILDGNCSFNIKYLGYVEVSEPTNSKLCCESIAKLYQEYKTGICHQSPAILWITGYELRIVDKTSKSDRLCKAVGFAFRVCLRRKTIREGPTTNTTISTRSIG